MKISSLKVYRGTTYEVILDENRRIYLHADIIADFGIHQGDEIERDELHRIIYASNFRRAYQRALYLLDYRDYSEKEMTKKLADNYKNEELCVKVVGKLKENSLIDDERYAEKLARRYVESKKYGYRRALREIMLKGIDKFTAEDALNFYRETFGENLDELIEKKYSRLLTDEDDRKSIEKVKNSLVRYGYEFYEVNNAVKAYFEKLED